MIRVLPLPNEPHVPCGHGTARIPAGGGYLRYGPCMDGSNQSGTEIGCYGIELDRVAESGNFFPRTKNLVTSYDEVCNVTLRASNSLGRGTPLLQPYYT